LEDLDLLDERISPLADELEELDRDSNDGEEDADRERSDNESSDRRDEGED
jgi:pre-mRNA-splicing factor 38A